MSEVINVLNLERRTERMESFHRQSLEQGFSYKRWEGVENPSVPVFTSISHAHKNIVKYAKATNKPYIIVAEDDLVFVGGNGAWKYYLDNMPKNFSLYFGGVYEGKIVDNKLVKGKSANEMLAGLTLYTISEKFYDIFLNINPMSHLDKSIGAMADDYDFYVCDQFVCKQMNGYSDQKKRFCYYDRYLRGRKMFGG